ncbi:hypothetical protein SAMN04487995_4742 [Dyadobacter koreensis]|uniref:Uncharacterized protein n=1 Tax=Dyadobacter koreensis TaxID=408657 RepID=A0A1H6YYQ7_9BACT|nr:hypothetical protein SAMN04487995_4742 [Dyadobacter koreensis]
MIQQRGPGGNTILENVRREKNLFSGISYLLYLRVKLTSLTLEMVPVKKSNT